MIPITGSAFWQFLSRDTQEQFFAALMRHADETMAETYEARQPKTPMLFDEAYKLGDEAQRELSFAVKEILGIPHWTRETDAEVWEALMASFATVERQGGDPEQPSWAHKYQANSSGLPRLMVMGHARHGKDTVCEIMEELYGLQWISSSLACSDKVIQELIFNKRVSEAFSDWLPEDKRVWAQKTLQDYREGWSSYAQSAAGDIPLSPANWAFEVRDNYRELWYQAIRHYNWEDPTLLCREIMSTSDVYCGIRDSRELTAIKNSGLLDAVIWVDASKRKPPEDASSISVQPWHADIHLDNNEGLPELRTAIKQMMWGQFGLLPKE